MTNSPFQVGETYRGGGRHARHAITVMEVRPVGEEDDRVRVVCECGVSWAFLHWRPRLGRASGIAEGVDDPATGGHGWSPLTLLRRLAPGHA